MTTTVRLSLEEDYGERFNYINSQTANEGTKKNDRVATGRIVAETQEQSGAVSQK